METALPVNIDRLLHQRAIEGERVDYKAGRNRESVLPTLSAFANDFNNLGCGYIIFGVEEQGGRRLQNALGISHHPHFVQTYLNPALNAGLIEMTLPDKPTSGNQRYRRTREGETLARQIEDSRA